MTATLGGFWDSMLAEGRRWFVTATSDSHSNWRDGGNDFWPGEYSKTYVQARADHGDIVDGLRYGRIFVTTGDLVSEVDVIVSSGSKQAGIGGTLMARKGQTLTVTIRLRDPAAANAGGRTPDVARVDLITGPVTGFVADWSRDGEVLTMTHRIPAVTGPLYLRVRGTSSDEQEPEADPKGEDPWSDLWFYANPIFVIVK
jgi:hypothetical protein